MIPVFHQEIGGNSSTKRSVRQRLFVMLMRFLVVLFLILVLVLGGIQSWLTLRDKLEEQEKTLAAVASAIQRPLAAAVWNEDRKAVEENLRSVISFPEISYVKLRADLGNGSENFVQTLGAKPDSAILLTVKLFAPQSTGVNEKIGEIEIASDSDGLRRNIQIDLLGIFSMATVHMLAVGLLLLWAIRKLVAIPIGNLAEHVMLLGQNLATPPLPPPGNRAVREVAVLTDGINGMHELLRSHFDELKNLQDKLANHNDNLEDLVHRRTEELKLAKLNAEDANRIKGQFLANISHELRTPMNGLLISLDLLRRENVQAEERRRLAAISYRSAEGLVGLLDDIVDFSKLKGGQISVSERPCSPGAVVDTVIKTLISRAKDKGLSLTARMLPSMPDSIIADTASLRHILFNLISNAIKFTVSGRVSVRGRRGKDIAGDRFLLEFEVEDTGIGIAPNVIPSLFDGFSQADESVTRRYGGSGLGLALCKELCRLLDGNICVESVPGRGSVFYFTIACRSHDGESDWSLEAVNEQDVRNSLPPLHILAVDDSDINREAARALLEDSGHTVVTADRGAEAVRLAAETLFDVVLMDIQMPEMDGLGATRAIHALPPPNCRVPVVGWTAHVSETSRFDCLDAGMVGFVAKPLQEVALLNEISAALAVSSVLDPYEASGLGKCGPEAPVSAVERDALLDLELTRDLIDAMDEEWPSFVQNFEQTAVVQIAALKDTATSGGDYRKAAHTVKGMAWSVGGTCLGNVALNIEKCEVDQLAHLLSSLDDTLAATVNALYSVART